MVVRDGKPNGHYSWHISAVRQEPESLNLSSVSPGAPKLLALPRSARHRAYLRPGLRGFAAPRECQCVRALPGLAARGSYRPRDLAGRLSPRLARRAGALPVTAEARET